MTCAPPFWSEEALNPQVQSPLDCFDAAAKSISDCPDPRARIENSSNLGFPEVISDESQTASVNLSGELVGSNVASADRPNAISAIADGTEFEVVEGFRFNRNVAHFTKRSTALAAANYVAAIDWGDHSSSYGSILDDGRRLRVAGSHSYRNYGTYEVTVRIRGIPGFECIATTRIAVRDASLNAAGRYIRASAGREVHCVLAHFRDLNPCSNAQDFSAESSGAMRRVTGRSRGQS